MKVPPHILARTPDQQRLWLQCKHPRGGYTRFARPQGSDTVIGRFDAAAAIHSHRLAVKSQDRAITYAQLANLSGHYARAIQSRRKVDDPHRTVALLLTNGIDMIACMLAVLRLGLIYLPLDPRQPPGRLAEILADASVSLLVAESSVDDRVWLGPSWEIEGSFPEDSAALQVTGQVRPESPGYLLYTSGSTGKPKGVVQNHRGQLMDIANWTNDVQLGCHDRLALLTAYTQLGNQVIFASLLNGACVYPLEIRRLETSSLAEWMNDCGITILRSTATFFRNFAQTLPCASSLHTLRLVRLGGEPVYRSDFELYKETMPAAAMLCNALATTETGTITSILFDRDSRVESARLSVGYAVEGTSLQVVNPSGSTLAYGAEGEIVVESDYLALAYWRLDDLSARSFRTAGDGRRQYFTGDIGVLAASGELTHLGRNDSQIKIGGNRVEPAEIELKLTDLEGIRLAAVKTIDADDADKGLVAYLVADGAAGRLPDAELDVVMAASFPDYMRPRVYCWLESFPQTDNGKTDYRNLPAVNPGVGGQASEERLPGSGTEQAVYAIWKEVLGLGQFNWRMDFVSLGGTSLQAMHIVSRVLSEFGTHLRLRDLFESSTVTSMAKLICAAEAGADAVPGGLDHRRAILEQLGLTEADLAIPGRLAEVVDGLPIELVDHLLQSAAQNG